MILHLMFYMNLFVIKNLILVKQSEFDILYPILKKYKDAKEENRILTVPFTTLIEYMWLLRGSCMLMDTKYSLLYLAAAVSDFYIPPNEMVCCELGVYGFRIIILLVHASNGLYVQII